MVRAEQGAHIFDHPLCGAYDVPVLQLMLREVDLRDRDIGAISDSGNGLGGVGSRGCHGGHAVWA